jgi:hypothetical protein
MSFTNADYPGLLLRLDQIASLIDGVDAALVAELQRLESLLR